MSQKASHQGGDTFYEAAVMLAVFLLFGHWMEMRGPSLASAIPLRLLSSVVGGL